MINYIKKLFDKELKEFKKQCLDDLLEDNQELRLELIQSKTNLEKDTINKVLNIKNSDEKNKDNMINRLNFQQTDMARTIDQMLSVVDDVIKTQVKEEIK